MRLRVIRTEERIRVVDAETGRLLEYVWCVETDGVSYPPAEKGEEGRAMMIVEVEEG